MCVCGWMWVQQAACGKDNVLKVWRTLEETRVVILDHNSESLSE